MHRAPSLKLSGLSFYRVLAQTALAWSQKIDDKLPSNSLTQREFAKNLLCRKLFSV